MKGQDKAAIINMILGEWVHDENRAYHFALKRKNEYIDRLHAVIADLCRENERLISEERVLYDVEGRPHTFRRNTRGHFVEVQDLTGSPTRRRVRRRLALSDSDSDVSTDFFE